MISINDICVNELDNKLVKVKDIKKDVFGTFVLYTCKEKSLNFQQFTGYKELELNDFKNTHRIASLEEEFLWYSIKLIIA